MMRVRIYKQLIVSDIYIYAVKLHTGGKKDYHLTSQFSNDKLTG